MNAHLVPCPGCTRHVRVVESACPFCGDALPLDLAASPIPVPPPAGLSRGGRFRYGALGVKALVGAAATASMLACDIGGDDSSVAAYGIACDPSTDNCGIPMDAGPDVVLADAQIDDGGSGDSRAEAASDGGSEATSDGATDAPGSDASGADVSSDAPATDAGDARAD